MSVDVELPDGRVISIDTADPKVAADAAKKFLAKSSSTTPVKEPAPKKSRGMAIPGGGYMFFDPEEQKQFMKGQVEGIKGFGSGLGKTVTGAMEAVPGKVGELGAAGTQELSKIGAPMTQDIGQMVGATVPVAGAFRAVSTVGKIIPQLPKIAGGIQRVLGNTLGGIFGGGVTGFLSPTGETNEKKRYEKKQESALEMGALGGLIGGGVSAVSELYGAYKYVRGVIDQAKQTTQKMSVELGENIAGATKGAEQEISNIQSQLDKIASAQAEIEIRDAQLAAQRATNSTLTPEQASKLQARIIGQIRDRMNDAQKMFEEAGHSKQAAANLVFEQEALIAQHKANIAQTSEGIVNQFKTAGLTENQFATMVSDAARTIRANLTKLRTEGARWNEALRSAGDTVRVPTQSTLDKIEKYRGQVNNPQTEGVLDIIRNRLQTVTKEGTEKVPGLSVERADSLRKYLDEIIEAKALKGEGGLALPKETLAIVKQIRKDLTLNAVNAWEPYKQAMVKFAQLSKPLRPFERKGMLANVAKERADLEEQLITDGKIVADVLNRSRGGEFGIAQLIGRASEMKNALRAYWSRSLAEGKEKLTVGDFRKFLDSNEDILKRVGLYDDFAKAGNPLAVLNQSLREAEAAIPALKESVTARGAEQVAAGKTLKEQENLLAKAREREARARDVATRTKVEEEAKEAAEKAKEKLGERETALKKSKSKPEALIKEFSAFKNKLDTAEANQIPEIGRSIADKLFQENIIDKAAHFDLLQKMQILEQQSKTAEEARRITKRLIQGATGAGLGYAGIRGIQWGVGRLFTGD